jgi:hypothetical protein
MTTNGDRKPEARPTPEALRRYWALVNEIAENEFQESQLPREEIAAIIAAAGRRPYHLFDDVDAQSRTTRR